LYFTRGRNGVRKSERKEGNKMAEVRNGGDLLSEKQVAEEFFNGLVSVRTIQTWRRLRKGPPFVKVGHSVFYRRADLVAYIERSVVATEIAPALAPK
jgi:hypothetical protein